MAVQVQQPTRKKRDIFDVLLTGLQAASAITNIQKARAELEAIPEAKERLRRQEETQFAAQFTEVPEGTAGGIKLTPPGADKSPGVFLPRSQVVAQGKANKELGKERFKQFGEIQDDLLKNKDFQKASSKVFDASTLLNLSNEAKKGNQPAFEQMKVIIARMNQGGVLTDRDVAMLGGSQEWSQLAKRFVETKLVGDVRPEDVEDLLDVANAAKTGGFETAKTIRKGVLDRAESRFVQSGIDVPRKTLEEITQINELIEAAAAKFPARTTPVRRPGLIPGTLNQNLEQNTSPIPAQSNEPFNVDLYLRD